MRRGFPLEVPPCFVARKVTRERAHDVARARVMAFDQIAVIGVHDAHEVGKGGGRRGVQAAAEPGGRRSKLRHDVIELARHLIEQCGFDSRDRFEIRRIGRFIDHVQCYKIAFPGAVWPIIWPISTWPMPVSYKFLSLRHN